MSILGERKREVSFSTEPKSGRKYVVLQVMLTEKVLGRGSDNLDELEDVINQQADKGYTLHTLTTTNSGDKGMGGNVIQATMVFERVQ